MDFHRSNFEYPVPMNFTHHRFTYFLFQDFQICRHQATWISNLLGNCWMTTCLEISKNRTGHPGIRNSLKINFRNLIYEKYKYSTMIISTNQNSESRVGFWCVECTWGLSTLIMCNIQGIEISKSPPLGGGFLRGGSCGGGSYKEYDICFWFLGRGVCFCHGLSLGGHRSSPIL